MVDAIADHEMLTFLDAWSGYNHIKRHPDDQEKTAFRSDMGIYCYNVMKSKRFEWMEQHEKAFDEFKSYLNTPPLLSKPEPTEPLYIYLSVTEVESALYNLKFQIRTAIKSQALADFVSDFSPTLQPRADKDVLTLSEDMGDQRATNNEAEYKARNLGLHLALDLRVSHIEVYSNSQLILNHLNDWYAARDSKMVAYLKVVKDLKLCFVTFSIKQVPRHQNAEADALATLGATFKLGVISTVHIIRVRVSSVQDETLDWRQPYHDRLQNDVLSADKKEVKGFKMKASRFVLIENILLRRSMTGPYLRCLCSQEAQDVMHDIHSEECGNHAGGRSLSDKELRQRTTPKVAKGQTAFSLVCGAEAMIPYEVRVPTHRYGCITEDKNEVEMASNLDTVDVLRTRAQIRMAAYKQTVAWSYNRNVRVRTLRVGDQVLRKVFQNTKNQRAGKFSYNWEGPYHVESVVGNGAYKIMSMEGKLIHKPWNIIHLKEHYI
ncbi:uncharacterized protein LOC141607502 [Silene latifolia]|uniref:uncharacterized protein LOC141607502 n=1 Tax=Silene latifolia TaxID=37657 RepID=UPI003D771231